MSAIVETIRKEQEEARMKAQKKEEQEQKSQAIKWDKWVQAEEPRIAHFKKEIKKSFPCLKGDFKVNPREHMGMLDQPFSAIIEVEGNELELKKVDGIFTLIVPYQYTNGCGWNTTYNKYDIKSDSDLKHYIKEQIRISDRDREEAQKYWDSLPIGNTD